ncbi:MAG: FG-GAP-like repeat-containing protein [Pyrinomonadaceae bacterium]
MREFLDYALQHLLMQATLGKLRKRDRIFRRVFLLAVVLTTTATANAADGDLDRSYGNDGISIIRVDGRTAYSVGKPILLDDGKMLLGGVSNFLPMQNVGSSIILRVNANGTLDHTFGDDGKIINTTLVNLCALTRLPDGKIVIAGSFASGGELKFAATRYNADGTLDINFGANGYAIGVGGTAKALAIQPDGKIIVAGYATSDANSTDDFLLARFTENGSVDSTFGTNGFVRTDFFQGADRASSVVVQPDGQIVAAGFATDTTFTGTMQREDFALAGYDSNGTLDMNFGDGGFSTAQFGRQNLAQIQNLVAQEDGKMVVVGSHTPAGDGMAMARYDRSGILDGTFGDDGGKVIMDYPGIAAPVVFRAVTAERGGKMLSVAAPTGNAAPRDFFLLARCTRFGEIDRTLDGEGEVLVQLGSNTEASSAIALPDGKTIVAGVSDGNFFAARFVAPRPSPFDFDGDGRADVAVFRPNEGVWYLSNSSGRSYSVRFGLSGDKITPADYDGDGKLDIAVYRGGTWYISRSSDNQTSILQFGLAQDIPVAADYDGDNRADISVYRPSEGNWYVLRSSDGQTQITRFGLAEDKPTIGDFDGDGRNDIAVFRPSEGVWYRIDSRDNQIIIRQFGIAGDVPAAADFDGDRKADLAVYRGGVWYIEKSEDEQISIIQYGLSDDVPVSADYDGDSRADISVFRPSAGDWYFLTSRVGQSAVMHWGTSGDTPIAAAFVR